MTKEYLNKKPTELFWSFWLLIPYLLWIYSIVIELNKNLPKHRKLNKTILIGLLIYPLIYTITALTLTFGIANMNAIVPFHIGAMFCMFSLMILASTTIIRFEKSEKLKKSNGIELFLGIWCFIFGVWHIQPKLNEYIKRIK